MLFGLRAGQTIDIEASMQCATVHLPGLYATCAAHDHHLRAPSLGRRAALALGYSPGERTAGGVALLHSYDRGRLRRVLRRRSGTFEHFELQKL